MIEVIITREEMDREVTLSSCRFTTVPLSVRLSDYIKGRLRSAGVPLVLTLSEEVKVSSGELHVFEHLPSKSFRCIWREDNETN